MPVSFEEFKKMDLRVARIAKVDDHPNADKLYLVTAEVDRNPDGTAVEKTFVAGIKGHYTKEELLGKLIVIINNLQPATIRGVKSEGMLLAASEKDKIVILTLDKPIAVGSRIS